MTAPKARPDVAGEVERLFDREDFARKLRVRLAELHLTMREAAPLIGISLATVSRTCQGTKEPSVETYLRCQQWLSRAQTKDRP